ncbi:MAG TPA: hypothetical protein VH682_18315 [Gemmataceae bacterium]|jgi:hypothetical protein
MCLLLALAAPAQAMTYEDIEVTLQSDSKDKSSHGYFEYVFLITNRSAERPHTVTLSVPDQKGFTGSDHIRELRRTVRVGAKETVRVALLQPDYPHLGGEDVAVFLDERRQEYPVVLRPNATQHSSHLYFSRGGRGSFSAGAPEPLVLKSPSIRKTFPRAETPPGPGMGGMAGRRSGMRPPGAGPGGFPPMPRRGFGRVPPGVPSPAKPGVPANTHFLAEQQPLESWSTDWLAYARYDGIVVRGDDLKAMPPAVRMALWQYVETGGSLLVLGDADLRGLSVSRTKESEDGWRLVEAGFGRCIVSPDDDFDQWKENHFELLKSSWAETAMPWEGQRNSYEANEKFPVVDDIGVPIKGLFVLMFLFTLAIGPVNFLVLARKKRRIWMLWTTPAISLFTCLTVFGYMLLSEGWEGHLRTETLTLLDEGTHRATTIGWTAAYSPLTPSDGLHFDYQTEVVSQRAEPVRRAGVRSCTLDWSRDQHLASGWIEARVPAHFKVRKSEMRRERVTVRHETDQSVSIFNRLGAEMRRFSYKDEKGQLYTAEHVAAGAEAKLKLENVGEMPELTRTIRSVFLSPSWLDSMQGLASAPLHYLRPRSYLAEMDDSPFLEPALRTAKTRKCRSVVVGFLSDAIRE